MKNPLCGHPIGREWVKKYSWAALLPLVVGVVVLAHSVILQGRIIVCYEISARNNAATKIYWSIDKRFFESQSVSRYIKAGGIQKVCLAHRELRNINTIRIDPVDQETEFSISKIYIERLDMLFPWRQLQRMELSIDSVSEIHDANALGDQRRGRYSALSVDPYFTFELNHDQARIRNITALNFVSFSLLLVCGFILLGVSTRARLVPLLEESAQGLALFLLYPVYCLAAWSVENYADLFRFSHIVIYLCVVMLLLYSYGRGVDRLTRHARIYLPVITIVLLVVCLDMSVRIGLVDKSFFSKPIHDPYHWNISRSIEDNLDNSSVRYDRDFRRLRTILAPGSRFLADVPTSYFVTAALDMYPVVAHRHHKDWVHVYLTTINHLCRSRDPMGFRRHLRVKSEQVKTYGLPLPRYMIIVHDPKNRQLRNSCLGRQFETVKKTLKDALPLVFEGEYAMAFELRY